jgi:predicted transcriptional regulator
VSTVVRKSEVTTLSIYIPKSKLDRKPIERLDHLAKKVDRSINYLVVEAILQYLDREEKRK